MYQYFALKANHCVILTLMHSLARCQAEGNTVTSQFTQSELDTGHLNRKRRMMCLCVTIVAWCLLCVGSVGTLESCVSLCSGGQCKAGGGWVGGGNVLCNSQVVGQSSSVPSVCVYVSVVLPWSVNFSTHFPLAPFSAKPRRDECT